jgi:proteasome lid subunit RPN8/RPN11
MGFFNKKRKIVSPNIPWNITQSCLNLIFECAKSSYPHEFGGLLRVDQQQKHTIVELVILPGTISGDAHAIFKLHMMPIDYTIVGTVHSHPSPHPYPSKADLALFDKYGKIHIITATPYDNTSWRAYDTHGNPTLISLLNH